MKTTNQIAVFATLLALTGCSPSSTSDGGKPPAASGSTGAVLELPKTVAAVPAPPPVPPPGEQKESFIASMEQKLKEFDAKIGELVKKTEGYKDDAKTQADQALAALREQRAKLSTQFESLKQASTDAWKELKAGFEAAFADLQKALEDARSKFS